MCNRKEGNIVICTEKPESQNFYLLIFFKHISRVFFFSIYNFNGERQNMNTAGVLNWKFFPNSEIYGFAYMAYTFDYKIVILY